MWSVLPLGYTFKPHILRWGLGAHDICFTNKYAASLCPKSILERASDVQFRMFANFFTYGQVLPTHRLKHSQHGGLFQPTFTEAIRLLSSSSPSAASSYPPRSSSDPSTSGTLPYHTSFPENFTNGQDVVPSPSIHSINRYSWVHVFPEGAVHQHPSLDMRYFKWGVSRLILESEPLPDVVPIFVDGFQHVMPEDRTFPRFLPRIRKNIRVAFGDVVDSEALFGDLRRRWRELVERRRNGIGRFGGEEVLGELRDEELRDGPEAREIRIEVARRVREEVMKLRRQMGYPDGDPALGDAETWAKEKEGKKYRSAVDGSLINQD
jgi:monolysocardiolipin acyltransferase